MASHLTTPPIGAAALHPDVRPSRPNAVQLHDDERSPTHEELTQAHTLRTRLIFGTGSVPAAATILGCFGALWWPFQAMDLFRVQYAALLVVIIALALWVRHWKAAALFVLPVLLNAWLVAPLYLSPEHAGALRLSSLWTQSTPTAFHSVSAGEATGLRFVSERGTQGAMPGATRSPGDATAAHSAADGSHQALSSSAGPAVTGHGSAMAEDGLALQDSLSLMLYQCGPVSPDVDRPFDFLRSSTADLLVLQHVTPDWNDPLRWRLAPFRLQESAPRGGSFGQAVLGRFRFPNQKTGIQLASRRISLLPGNHHPSFETLVQLKAGKVIVLSVSVPMPLDAESARQHNMLMKMLSFWVQKQVHPVVVVGNLGTTPWSSSFTSLLDETGLVNSQMGHGLQATWPAQGGLPFGSIPIDHVLHSPEIVINERKVLPAVESNHRALQVELTIAPGTVSQDEAEVGPLAAGQEPPQMLLER